VAVVVEDAQPRGFVARNTIDQQQRLAPLATLSKVSFVAPGTFAEIAGTYNLLNKTIDLRGVLHTQGKLSDTTSGFKAIVLKGLSPFLKKKSITVVRFTIKGTSAHLVFALDPL
jgi:hypothetical protein